jgi:hypothetical protein
MNETIDKPESLNNEKWIAVGNEVCRTPLSPVPCPCCNSVSVRATWNIIDHQSRLADMEFRCKACHIQERIHIVLPRKAFDFFPLTRLIPIRQSLDGQASDEMRRHSDFLPAIAFTADPLWLEAQWSATTFRCHPNGAAPPTMGLVFENTVAAKRLFTTWVERHGNDDEFEEIRISIIEGEIPGQPEGYSVHICPDPENSLIRPGMKGISLTGVPLILIGHIRRMFPKHNNSFLLRSFREAYEQHMRFMIAPVLRRDDGQLWFDVQLGIIKSTVNFRATTEIGDRDIDACVLANESRQGD